MINQIVDYIKILASSIPLEAFVFIGSILEEIIAPIPSPLVMMIAGTLAHAQNHTLPYLLLLALVASLGKTIGSWFFYILADKTEDLLLTRFGKILGVSHKEVETIGKHFNGGWKDDVILFLLRAVPIMPTTIASLVCGFIKLNIRTYLRATFFGYFVRSFIFLYLGYTGIATYDSLSGGLGGIESLMKMAFAFGLIALLAWVFYKRGSGNIHDWLKHIKR